MSAKIYHARRWWGLGPTVTGICALGLVALIIVAVHRQYQRSQPWTGFQAPNDIQAGREALAESYAAPRYFQHVGGGPDFAFPFMAVAEARAQVATVAAARSLAPEARERLEKVIQRLEELSPSRAFGSERVNVLQLNLALDEMPAAEE